MDYFKGKIFYHQRDTRNQGHTMVWNSFTAGWRPPTYFVFGFDFMHHCTAKYKTRVDITPENFKTLTSSF